MDGYSRSRRGPQLVVGLIVAAVAIVGYFASRSPNPVTGEVQSVALSPAEEVALGLHSAPQMAAQHGGLDSDERAQQLVDAVGTRLLRDGLRKETPYQFDFHLLRDPQTVNAFALPGGQVFITRALFDRLKTEGQLAGVLGHEIGHVIERHGAEHLAKAQLTQGLVGAVAVGSADPNDPRASARNTAIAAAVGQLLNLRYGREDELECDEWGVELLGNAGYDPRALIEVMKVLAQASGGGGPPEFFSTHPNPDNRIGRIEDAIRRRYPQGVPGNLTP
ncbi:MAG: M48 family metalloprotease [Phycisphaerae bacterium]|nr:M48 family metalloprotease [Phycisphaerae bacterium]